VALRDAAISHTHRRKSAPNEMCGRQKRAVSALLVMLPPVYNALSRRVAGSLLKALNPAI